MKIQSVFLQPSVFIATAFVTACALALAATVAGYAIIDGATQAVLAMPPVVQSSTVSR